MLIQLAVKFIVYFVATLVCGQLLTGAHFDRPLDFVIVAFALVLLNLTIKPLLRILTLPITLITLGLFSLILNALIVLIADILIEGFWLDNFLWAFAFGILFSLVVGLLEMVFKPSKKRN